MQRNIIVFKVCKKIFVFQKFYKDLEDNPEDMLDDLEDNPEDMLDDWHQADDFELPDVLWLLLIPS
jgi:hypothetical protein